MRPVVKPYSAVDAGLHGRDPPRTRRRGPTGTVSSERAERRRVPEDQGKTAEEEGRAGQPRDEQREKGAGRSQETSGESREEEGSVERSRVGTKAARQPPLSASRARNRARCGERTANTLCPYADPRGVPEERHAPSNVYAEQYERGNPSSSSSEPATAT